jgi:hypothetical protein
MNNGSDSREARCASNEGGCGSVAMVFTGDQVKKEQMANVYSPCSME